MALNIDNTDSTQIIADLGRTVAHSVATKTTNPITGDESVSFGSPSNITAVFLKKSINQDWGPWGILKHTEFSKTGMDLCDAYLYSATSANVARDDKIVVDSETYIVHKVVRRKFNDNSLFDFCNLVITNG